MILVFTALSTTASAQHGTLVLDDGTRIEGEVRRDGDMYVLDEIDRLQVPASSVVEERRDAPVPGARPSVVTLGVLSAASAALVGVGIGLAMSPGSATGEICDEGCWSAQGVAGLVLSSAGALLGLATLAVALPIRLTRRRRWDRSHHVDLGASHLAYRLRF